MSRLLEQFALTGVPVIVQSDALALIQNLELDAAEFDLSLDMLRTVLGKLSPKRRRLVKGNDGVGTFVA